MSTCIHCFRSANILFADGTGVCDKHAPRLLGVGPRPTADSIMDSAARRREREAKKLAALRAVLPVSDEKLFAELSMVLPSTATVAVDVPLKLVTVELWHTHPLAEALWLNPLPGNVLRASLKQRGIALPIEASVRAAIESYIASQRATSTAAPDLCVGDAVEGIGGTWRVTALVGDAVSLRHDAGGGAVDAATCERAEIRRDGNVWRCGLRAQPVAAPAPAAPAKKARRAQKELSPPLEPEAPPAVDERPAFLRDVLAAVTLGWWCVITGNAFSPRLSTLRAPDEETAARFFRETRAEAEVRGWSAVVVVDDVGLQRAEWTRWPSTHPDLEGHGPDTIFRVSIDRGDVRGDAHAWAVARGLHFFGDSDVRLSPSERAEGAALVHWLTQGPDAVAIVPRSVALWIFRRAVTPREDGSRVADPRFEPWRNGDTWTGQTALMSLGGRVLNAEGIEWRVLMLRSDTVLLTRTDADVVAEADTSDLRPSGEGNLWRVRIMRRPRTSKAKRVTAGGAP